MRMRMCQVEWDMRPKDSGFPISDFRVHMSEDRAWDAADLLHGGKEASWDWGLFRSMSCVRMLLCQLMRYEDDKPTERMRRFVYIIRCFLQSLAEKGLWMAEWSPGGLGEGSCFIYDSCWVSDFAPLEKPTPPLNDVKLSSTIPSKFLYNNFKSSEP
jgi:hypothetical protein